MQKTNLALSALRILLVVAFAVVVVFQVFSMPGQFAYMAEQDPDDAYRRWPFTVLAALVLGCVQVVIVSTWKLVSFVKNDRIFTDSAFPWVTTIMGAIGAAWVLLLGLFVYLAPRADDPAVPMLLMVALVGGAVLELLIFVMRALLRQATTLRTDMEAVI